jgi:hypothetical protein
LTRAIIEALTEPSLIITFKIIAGDSKMVTRGRKQKVCFLKKNLGETLEIHLAGKTTKKRQNSNTSTPPACV